MALGGARGGRLTYSEIYRDVEYWENGLAFKVIYRDLTFFLSGAYGTFGRGTVYQRYADFPSRFHFKTDGWSADGTGYFGYAVNLTADRTYKILLTPLIGYSGHFEDLSRKGGSFASSLPGVFRLVWNGFLFGGGLTFEPGGSLNLHIGYSYHRIHNRMQTMIQNGLDGASLRQSVKTSSGGNSGQTGWAQLDWLLSRFWRLGVGGQIHYFSTRVVNAAVQEKSVEGKDQYLQRFKLRWTPFSAWAQISRTF